MIRFTQIAVSGSDATSFLQGQLTQDIAAVTDELSPLAAWCNPKGRVIVLLRLLAQEDGFGLVLPADLANAVTQRFTMFRLRAAVEFAAPAGDWHAQAVAGDSDLGRLGEAGLMPAARRNASRHRAGVHAVCVDPAVQCIEVYGRLPALDAAGLRFASPLSASRWQAARIAAGIADVTAESSERYTPHMLNLDRLAAISFDKGCYPGQEIVARTQYRGSAGRRLGRFRSSAALDAGADLEHEGKTVGQVVAAAEGEVLALLPVALHAERLYSGEAALEPLA